MQPLELSLLSAHGSQKSGKNGIFLSQLLSNAAYQVKKGIKKATFVKIAFKLEGGARGI